MFKKIMHTLLVSAAVLLVPAALAQTPQPQPQPQPQARAPLIPPAHTVAASSYLLIDADSGKVLTENNADTPLPQASLNKMINRYTATMATLTGHHPEKDAVLAREKALGT